MATVIIGAGIIGVSTAYYLSLTEKPEDIHLVEVSPQLFASASGNAAGFLARDWFIPSLARLGELSFDLHKQLAEENQGYRRWGYSRSSGSSLEERVSSESDWLTEGGSRSVAAAKTERDAANNGPTWLKHRDALDFMSDGSTTAQVDPLRLCRFLVTECMSRGVKLHQPCRPNSLIRSSSGDLSSVDIINTATQEKKSIQCTKLVLTAGAWTAEVYRTLFPESKTKLPITSLAGHSLVVQSPHWPPPKLDDTEDDNPFVRQDCHAVFTSDAEAGYSPEIFSRMPDGHIYLAGLNSSTYPLPKVASERVVDPESVAVLKKTAQKLLGDESEVIRESVCWRPVAKKGVPMICDLASKGERDVYLAAGHGAWGICKSKQLPSYSSHFLIYHNNVNHPSLSTLIIQPAIFSSIHQPLALTVTKVPNH